MARPKSEERRQAIIDSAIRLIAREGLGAATAAIAKEAGVPNGSLFTYFPTKIDLFNALYMEIKEELISTVDDGLSDAGDEREQLLHIWASWTRWGAANSEKRRVLAQLSVSDDVTEATKEAGFTAAYRSVSLIRQVARHGALRDQDPAFVGAVVESLASTTMDCMSRDPKHAEQVCTATFEFLWKALR
ncbi:TetR/AcrR family transcriptional regulator [Cupriavidus lacunae]|uniref:TetR/AcrR family transcriptional regulator n=1 Tax=Cupriavidus lacunae TaxID=2666307 RepID=UPI001374DDD5|nr:TetR/AcrR family transcriptional regulator [Cupriavidus lacunae]